MCTALYFFFPTLVLSFFFFFQAEDGIRDRTVTGVQTCALPISRPAYCSCTGSGRSTATGPNSSPKPSSWPLVAPCPCCHRASSPGEWRLAGNRPKIGRASCRERGEIAVGAGAVKKKIGRHDRQT